MEKEKDVNDLINLFKSNLIDDDKVCYISTSFFSMNYQYNPLVFQLPRIKNKYIITRSMIENLKLKNITSDFQQFFIQVIHKYEDEMEPILGYSMQIPFESELKYFILNNYTKEINIMLKVDAVELPDCIYDTVLRIYPKWSSLNQNQISISKLIFFISIFEILYTQRYHDMEQSSSVESYKALFKKANLSYKTLQLPSFFKNNILVDDNVSIREYFMSQSCFDNARNELLFVNFSSNPFDMLFHFHKVISDINLLARENQKKNYTIAFDDLFVLLYGIFLSSDLSDLFFASKVIDMYLKKFHLCSFFEYAKSTIEALVIYLKTP